MREEKGTDRERPLISTLTLSSIEPAIEAVARALTIMRPEEKEMRKPVSILMETVEFDISRINHQIEVELWKEKVDTGHVRVLTSRRDALVKARNEAEEKLSFELASGLLGLMESLKKIETVLRDEATPPLKGDRFMLPS